VRGIAGLASRDQDAVQTTLFVIFPADAADVVVGFFGFSMTYMHPLCAVRKAQEFAHSEKLVRCHFLVALS
jgi:hypothetical protein